MNHFPNSILSNELNVEIGIVWSINQRQPYRHKVGEDPVFINEYKHPSQPEVLFVFLTFRALKVRLVLVLHLKRTLESNGFLSSVFDVLFFRFQLSF